MNLIYFNEIFSFISFIFIIVFLFSLLFLIIVILLVLKLLRSNVDNKKTKINKSQKEEKIVLIQDTTPKQTIEKEESLEEENESSSMYCPFCGEQIPRNVDFCTQCGVKL